MTLSSRLAQRLAQNLSSFDAGLNVFSEAMPLSRDWIQREWPLSESVKAQSLLVGAKVALLEAATAWAIGSNCGAASSLRAYIENTFAWLYYKDHPVEFQTILTKHADMMLPKSVQNYIKNIDEGFEKAYNLISRKRVRTSEYYYTDVSQFVHAHPSFALRSENIEESAVSLPRDSGFLTISAMTDEFISDNYLAFYRSSWDDAPKSVQQNTSKRIGTTLRQFLDIS
jgi:hypothetical protein